MQTNDLNAINNIVPHNTMIGNFGQPDCVAAFNRRTVRFLAGGVAYCMVVVAGGYYATVQLNNHQEELSVAQILSRIVVGAGLLGGMGVGAFCCAMKAEDSAFSMIGRRRVVRADNSMPLLTIEPGNQQVVDDVHETSLSVMSVTTHTGRSSVPANDNTQTEEAVSEGGDEQAEGEGIV